jgi:hypothetical protein
MSRWLWRLAAAGGLVIVALCALVAMRGLDLHAYANAQWENCHVDGEIDAQTRQEIEASARRFTDALLGGQDPEAYALLSHKSRTTTSREAFDQAFTQLNLSRPFTDLQIKRTYFVDLIWGHGDGSSISCGPADAINTTGTIPLLADRRQARVLMSANGKAGRWTLTMRLHYEDGDWDVDGLDLSTQTD